MSDGEGAEERAARTEHEASGRLSASDLAEMRKEIEARLDALLGPAETVRATPADTVEAGTTPTPRDEDRDAHDAPPGDQDGPRSPSDPSVPDPSVPDPSSVPAAASSSRAADGAEERLRQARQRMAERQAEAERAASEAGEAGGRHAGGWTRVLVGAAVVVAAAVLALWLSGG